jgi:hypothetical protein
MKLLGRGHSIDFGTAATAYGNQATVNVMLNNQNPNDLFGRRGQYGVTINTLVASNQIFLENALPRIEVMDDTYYDDHGALQLYIPNGYLVVFGKRPNNRPLGNYRMTFNAQTGGGGSYMKIVDNTTRDVPRKIVVHRGHNGGPVIYFPSGVIVMKVY